MILVHDSVYTDCGEKTDQSEADKKKMEEDSREKKKMAEKKSANQGLPSSTNQKATWVGDLSSANQGKTSLRSSDSASLALKASIPEMAPIFNSGVSKVAPILAGGVPHSVVDSIQQSLASTIPPKFS